MAGFFSWLVSASKSVAADNDPVAPLYAYSPSHPRTGEWFARAGGRPVAGAYRCYGCGALAERSSLTETTRPTEANACQETEPTT